MSEVRMPPPVPGGTQDGTTQDQRLLPGLVEPVQVDALQLDQLLALTRRLAARLRYVDAHGHSSGTWEELFRHDGTLVLADMASFTRRSWDQRFAELCAASNPLPAAGHLLDLALQLDTWLRALDGGADPSDASAGGLADNPALGAVHDALQQSVMGQLASQLRWLLATFGHWPPGEGWPQGGGALHARERALSPAWRARQAWQAPGQNRRRQLRGVGHSFSTALARLQGLARERLPQTLGGGRHEPAVGLLLTFLQLYAQVQDDTNRLGARHIDFYHHEVLGFEPRPAVPDRVHVAFQADPLRQQPVVVPAGTVFLAGKDATGQALRFASETAVEVGQARVAALATLRLERADDVQPEADLGYVSAVRVQDLGLPGPGAAPVPCFGGGEGSQDASLGVALASSLLLMKEGRRRIELELLLDWPGTSVTELVRLALGTRSAEVFSRAVGQLYARWLLGDAVELTDSHRQRLRLRVRCFRLHPGSLRALLDRRPGDVNRQQMEFHRVVSDLFELHLTHPGGWLAARNVQLEQAPAGRSGLRLAVQLTNEDPPISGCDPTVHGAAWPTRLPLLKLQVSSRARIHPLSLFQQATLARVHLAVQVRGVRDLVVSNQLGPLDAGKVFAPFGPLPNTSSALVVGAPESAAKHLDSLSLTLEWSGLPVDGLRTHYAAYGAEQAQGPFTVALSLLRDGLWRPCGGVSAQQPLFGPPDRAGREPRTQHLEVDGRSVREHARASAQPLERGADVRDGLLRLELKHPRGAFGHAAYPGLLSDAVSSRTRRRGRQALPQAPYTPELQSLRLHYSASTTLDPQAAARSAPDAAVSEDSDRLLHIHPFGVAALRRAAQAGKGRAPGLLPPLDAEGSLFIGLALPPAAAADDDTLAGVLTLLFQMQPKGAATLGDGADRAPVSWAYLAQDQWQPLSRRHVLSDTTFGLLTTGVVTLDLPAGARRDNTLLGRGLFWLRASGRRDLDATAELISVQAHATTLARVLEPGAVPQGPLPAGRITQPQSPVPGLVAVQQPAAGTGLQPPESTAQLRVRVAERLRHKNRASLAWDFERLVLAHAPAVHKVKCFMAPAAGLAAGQVLVAVLPATRRNAPEMGTQALQLDALALRGLEDLLHERASPMVSLRVRNVSFERVQVRCRVQMARHAQPGALKRDINRALVRYLSPWHDTGFGPRMDWQLRCEDVQAELRRVPGVAGVIGLSLLHVVRDDDGQHHFDDTAAVTAGARDVLRARHPWSVVLPLEEHIIELLDQRPGTDTAPRPSGLTQLAVGETWVMT